VTADQERALERYANQLAREYAVPLAEALDDLVDDADEHARCPEADGCTADEIRAWAHARKARP
jgi:hypothetical protein